ncbi:MAG: aminopeptidase P family protein [Alphaproteobacteria bacterium]|nr:aminopeptidase P family protein [Alphaproteobacteria bacterium]MBU0795666.1 aminopeptidase P family protein [Alphaproteobacteria bacterium]MBU0887289.1 aminopeptidase P family protein [Alphaproteobacteria bacterium]MBU1811830.1 aminopeptidase P family protein [Alphaproteobacteria bacterium]
MEKPRFLPEHARRLADLRAELKRRGVDGFLVPRADEHQGEYVPARADRLNWLTGFTGSAGQAVVLLEKAAVFIDGRYTLQAKTQVDGSLYEHQHLTDQPPGDWVAANLPAGAALAYDPWLHTANDIEKFAAAVAKARGHLVALETNPLDAVWPDQPAAPVTPTLPHPLAYAGEEASAKRRRIADILKQAGQEATVLTLPESIAWLLNIRGTDVPHTPLPLSFAILHDDARVELFIDPAKLGPEVRAHLGNEVTLGAPGDFEPALLALGQAGRKVRVDPGSAPVLVLDRLKDSGATLLRGEDPCLLPKSCKNPVELAGTRAAHLRDGAAVTRFLAWLAQAAPSGTISEIEASDRLEALRAETGLLKDLSFDTISGAGPNGAIVHYRATEASDRRLQPGELYLVDSGGQYLDGTTDITRTIAIGTPDAEMRDRFTRVLKGHITIARARFPKGTTGHQLDALARLPLWQVGLDYDHGTGHGVGSYLSVHEGPQRLSRGVNTVALQPGMIVSNEPGYYKTGGYGIRIENLVVVTEAGDIPGGERKMLGFETLTLAPFDRALIDADLLEPAERDWLNAYQARVRAAITPLVDAETALWLEEMTRPV